LTVAAGACRIGRIGKKGTIGVTNMCVAVR
jgi:hypothetical protein